MIINFSQQSFKTYFPWTISSISLVSSIYLITAIVVRIHLSYAILGHRKPSDQHNDRDDVCYLYNSISFHGLIDDHCVFYIVTKIQLNEVSVVPSS